MGWFDWLLGSKPSAAAPNGQSPAATPPGDVASSSAAGLRAVPGALVASSGGRVVYNMLDPSMKQFMGRCIGAIKKSGIPAKGTGQFGIRLGDGLELSLDEFYSRADDPSVFQDVVAAAHQAVKAAQAR